MLENRSTIELQLSLRKVITFYFYHAGHVLVHEDHYRSDFQSGFLLVRTLPTVKIRVLSLSLLKKFKWNGKMEIRGDTENL